MTAKEQLMPRKELAIFKATFSGIRIAEIMILKGIIKTKVPVQPRKLLTLEVNQSGSHVQYQDTS
jgi:hypothetical protein